MQVEGKPNKESNRPVLIFLGAVVLFGLLLIGGILGKRQLNVIQIVNIAKANQIPLSKEELYPPYTGDPAKNAVTYLADAKFKGVRVEMPGRFNNQVWTKAAGRKILIDHPELLALARRAAACDTYSPVPVGDGPNLLSPAFENIDVAIELLVVSGRVAAEEDHLQESLADFKGARDLTNMAATEPSVVAIGTVSRAVNLICTSILNWSPFYKGHNDEFGQLLQIVAGFKKLDYVKEATGEAYKVAYLATRPISLDFWETPEIEYGRAIPQLAYNTRDVWGRETVQDFAEDIRDLRRESPVAFTLPRVESLGRRPDINQVGVVPLLGAIRNTEQYRKQNLCSQDLAILALTAVRDGKTPDVSKATDPYTLRPYRLVVTTDGWRLYSPGVATSRPDDLGAVRPLRGGSVVATTRPDDGGVSHQSQTKEVSDDELVIYSGGNLRFLDPNG